MRCAESRSQQALPVQVGGTLNERIAQLRRRLTGIRDTVRKLAAELRADDCNLELAEHWAQLLELQARAMKAPAPSASFEARGASSEGTAPAEAPPK